MVDLNNDFPAVLMNQIGQAPESRNMPARCDHNLLERRSTACMHARTFDRDVTDTAFDSFQVIGNVTIIYQSIGIRKISCHRRHDQPVL